MIVVTAVTEEVTQTDLQGGRTEAGEKLCLKEWEWWKEREIEMLIIRHRPSLRSSLPELDCSVNRGCHGNAAFPLTPCERSHRISPERELKCQHGSRHCHVGLRGKICVCFSAQSSDCASVIILLTCVHYSLLCYGCMHKKNKSKIKPFIK